MSVNVDHNPNVEIVEVDLKKDQKEKKSYLGRTISWFRNTSSGRSTGAILRGLGALLFGAAGVIVAISSVALFVFAIASFSTVIGIPIGLLAITAAGGGLLLARDLFRAAGSMFRKAENNLDKAQKLAEEEAST